MVAFFTVLAGFAVIWLGVTYMRVFNAAREHLPPQFQDYENARYALDVWSVQSGRRRGLARPGESIFSIARADQQLKNKEMPDPIGDGNGIGDWWDGLGVAPSADAAPAPVRKLSSFIRGAAQPDPSSSAALPRSAALAGVAARQPGSPAFPSVPFPLEALLAPVRDLALDQWVSSSLRRVAPPFATEASTVLPGSSAPVAGKNPINLDQLPAGGLLGMIQDYMRNNGYWPPSCGLDRI